MILPYDSKINEIISKLEEVKNELAAVQGANVSFSVCEKTYGSGGKIKSSEVGALSCSKKSFAFTWSASNKPKPYSSYEYRPLFDVRLTQPVYADVTVSIMADIPIMGALLMSDAVDFFDESKGGVDISKVDTSYFINWFNDVVSNEDVVPVFFGYKSYLAGYAEDNNNALHWNKTGIARLRTAMPMETVSLRTRVKNFTLVVFVKDDTLIPIFDQYANWLTLKVVVG